MIYTWIKNLGVAAALLGASVAADSAQAQNYPTRAITLVIPFAPGGSTSIVGRAIADKLSEVLGEKVVVDNRPGAGGTVGTKAVAKSDPMVTRCCWATPARWRSAPRFTRIPATIRARISRRSA